MIGFALFCVSLKCIFASVCFMLAFFVPFKKSIFLLVVVYLDSATDVGDLTCTGPAA